MKNFKKLLCLILAFMFVFSFAACGDNSSNSNNNDDQEDNTPVNPEPVTFEGTIEFELPNSEGTVKAEADTTDYFISKTSTFFAIINNNDSASSTYAQIKYIEGETSEDIAPSYIDTYVGKLQDYEYPGTIEIGKDGLCSEMVIASDDEQYVELYIVNLDSGALAIVISVSAELKETEYPILHNLVDTLEIVK